MAYASEVARPVAARRRTLSGVKWATAMALVVVLVSGAAGAAIVGRRVQYGSGSGFGTTLLVILFAIVGFVLAIRRPRNPIGWLFLSGSVCFALSGLATPYSILDYVHDHGSLPLGWVSLLFAEFWAPAIVLISVATLLFPDGRLSSRTMRLLFAALLLAAVVWQGGAFGIAVYAIVTHSIRIDNGGDLYAIDHAVGAWAWWFAAAQPAFFTTLAAVWLGWLLQQVPAYRRSTGDRRLQLKWLYGGVTLCGIGGILLAATTSTSSEPLRALGDFGTVLLCALPLSVGVALLKFHLYDIDKVVSRTVSYVLLTGMLVGLYAGVVTFVTRVLPYSSAVGVAASTLLAAAAFNPLRKRLQRIVDRRFNRARYDAEAIIATFTSRLRDAVDLETVRSELLEVVNAAVEPEHASVWIKQNKPISRRL